MSETLQQYHVQILKEIAGAVVTIAFISMVILEVVKKFKEVTK